MIMPNTDEKISNLKAKTYEARFLEAGIVKYNKETVLIKKQNLFGIAISFKGCPIFINHQSINKDEKDLKNKSVGHISKIYLRDDGWAWCDFIITNKKAVDLIESGYSISCAYIPETFGIGGKYHNIAYDREIITAKGTHIAVVKNPRYEDVIVYENSKKKGNNMIKKIFRFKSKEKKEVNNSQEEIIENELENSLVEIDGEKVEVSKLIEVYNNKKEEERKIEEEKQNTLNEDDEVIINKKGDKVKVSELINSYNEYKNKCSEKAEMEKKNKEEEKKEKEEEKKNALVDFEKIKNKKVESELKNSKKETKKYVSDKEKYELGAKLYGPIQSVINK